MKLRTRRILLITCIILFFIIFPIVLLQSFGYRYDFKEKKLVRTGIIYITATPQNDIRIYVDGKEEKEKLSVKGIFNKDYVLFNLLPQSYDIQVAKDGYSKWEKRLSVSPGLNTYARPLLLPLNPDASQIFEDENIINWSASPDFKKISYLKKEKDEIVLSVYDIENKKNKPIILSGLEPNFKKSILQSASPETKFYWDSDSKNIILDISSKISYIIDSNAAKPALISLEGIRPDAKIINGAWGKDNSIFLFQTGQKELYYFTISDPNKAIKISDNISGFAAANNIIYYLDSKNLYVYSLPGFDAADKKQISNSPLYPIKNDSDNTAENNAEIIVSGNSNIAVISSNKDLFIIDQSNTAPSYVGGNISFAEFSTGGDSLLFGSPFEIYTYSIGDKTKSLITRMAQKLEKTSWYKGYEHIWFINNNIIKNIETDSRPMQNIIDFINLSSPVLNFSYDINLNTIYYDQTNNGTISFHRIIIE